jgi:transcriptional regulator with XRE-family HTH domain
MPSLLSLKTVRESHLLSQRQLAKLSGVEQATIARLERNRQRARSVTIKKLARALHVSLSALIMPPPDQT